MPPTICNILHIILKALSRPSAVLWTTYFNSRMVCHCPRTIMKYFTWLTLCQTNASQICRIFFWINLIFLFWRWISVHTRELRAFVVVLAKHQSSLCSQMKISPHNSFRAVEIFIPLILFAPELKVAPTKFILYDT